MTAMRFVDTNDLIYAACALSEEANKRHRAIDLLKEGDLALSVQVIQEFYYLSTRVSRQAHITHEQAINFIGSMDTFPVQPINLDIFHAAVVNLPTLPTLILGRRNPRRRPSPPL